MSRGARDWARYERLVATLMRDQLSPAYCVTPNARVKGVFSGRKRQIDVLIDSRHASDDARRLIVDAKVRVRRIDVTHIEAFLGLMSDVNATHGYLVCPSGYTKAAEQRAQSAAVSIRLLPLDRLDDFDPSSWPQCLDARCNRGRIFWDGYPAVDMGLAPAIAGVGERGVVTFLHYVGKCDQCGRFHVRCMTCGDLFSPTTDSRDYGVQCSCRLPWFWLASIEEDDAGQDAAELHWVCGEDQILTVDRRSL